MIMLNENFNNCNVVNELEGGRGGLHVINMNDENVCAQPSALWHTAIQASPFRKGRSNLDALLPTLQEECNHFRSDGCIPSEASLFVTVE
jgi:hypothetical protein